MFERYTEKARRVIFFARYEASQFGSPYIETEHLLLGMLREDKALTDRFLRAHSVVETIRKEVEEHTTVREKTSTSVDLPLSNESKRVLAYAAEEAERLGHKHIGTEHLFLGLMREEKCLAAEILKERGLKLEAVREELTRPSHEEKPMSSEGSAPAAEGFQDLTAAAEAGLVGPIVGREVEIDSVAEVLSNRGRRNVLLVGPRGAGKAAVVEGLAVRISEGRVPRDLANNRVLAIGPRFVASLAAIEPKLAELARRMSSGFATGPAGRTAYDLARLLGSGENLDPFILFIEDLHELVESTPGTAAGDLSSLLKRALKDTGLQCIGTTDAEGLNAIAQRQPRLLEYFRLVYLRPLGAEEMLAVLRARKAGLEKFHAVRYSEEALDAVVRFGYGASQQPSSAAQTLELLDAAGAAVKVRRGPEPAEIADLRQRMRVISLRCEEAVRNHEFEKARYYSDEEGKERENLRVLEEKHGTLASAPESVTAADIELVVARWSKYPYSQ
ncbi:MAG TPA: Clp protease N-terminal domain-containing protein [Terracidiphilus sp.]